LSDHSQARLGLAMSDQSGNPACLGHQSKLGNWRLILDTWQSSLWSACEEPELPAEELPAEEPAKESPAEELSAEGTPHGRYQDSSSSKGPDLYWSWLSVMENGGRGMVEWSARAYSVCSTQRPSCVKRDLLSLDIFGVFLLL
jgi:hypothetical protein